MWSIGYRSRLQRRHNELVASADAIDADLRLISCTKRVDAAVVSPCLVPNFFLQYPSHRIFEHMHRTLYVVEKN